MTEIIKELDKTPVGQFGLRKRLTKTTDENGNVFYSVREYAPRPVFSNAIRIERDDSDIHYVPARGIDLTEEELTVICKQLRFQLYDVRNISYVDIEHDFDDSDDSEGSNESDEDDYDESSALERLIEDNAAEREYEDDDPVPEQDFERELGVEYLMPIACFPKGNSAYKELELASWHGQYTVYDLREHTKKINSRGYEEYVPELDKGLTLSDYEAEMLCQGIELLFPDVAEQTAEFRDDDYMDSMSEFELDLSEHNRKIAIDAFDREIDYRLKRRLSGNAFNTAFKERFENEAYNYLCGLRRKLQTGEMFTDDEACMCISVLITESECEDNFAIRASLVNIAVGISDQVSMRGRLPSAAAEDKSLRKVIASSGEFGAASDVLRQLYKEMYEGEDTSQKQKVKREIDCIVIDDADRRYGDRSEVAKKGEKNPGKAFIKSMIDVFGQIADSPLREPPY